MYAPHPRRVRHTIRLHPLHLTAIIAVTAIGTGGLYSIASNTEANWQTAFASGMIAANFLTGHGLIKRLREIEALLRRSLLLQSTTLDDVHSATIDEVHSHNITHNRTRRRRSISENDDPSGGYQLPNVPRR